MAYAYATVSLVPCGRGKFLTMCCYILIGPMLSPKFDADRFKTQVKLAKCRLENLLKALRNMSGGRRKEIATCLAQHQEERARVNVKYLIRDDYMMEAYELLITYCEDVLQSTGLIAREKNCDPDLMLPAKSLIYAAGRIEVPELNRIREQLESKYGKDFVDVNSEVGRTAVDPSLIVKLSIRTPDIKLMNQYMAAIAQIFGVNWQPPVDPDQPIHRPASPVVLPTERAASPAVSDDKPPPYSPHLSHIPPHSPSIQDSPASVPQPPVDSTVNNGIPDFDELQRRFQALKKN